LGIQGAIDGRNLQFGCRITYDGHRSLFTYSSSVRIGNIFTRFDEFELIYPDRRGGKYTPLDDLLHTYIPFHDGFVDHWSKLEPFELILIYMGNSCGDLLF
jgi:hypothetical protein